MAHVWRLSPSGVVSATVVAPSGAPLANAEVSIYAGDPPSDATTTWDPTIISTTTTDANDNWAFAVPSYASLPPDAQAAADNSGGSLNLEATALRTASVTIFYTY